MAGANIILPRSSRLPSMFQPKLRRAPCSACRAAGSLETAPMMALCSNTNSSKVGIGSGLHGSSFG